MNEALSLGDLCKLHRSHCGIPSVRSFVPDYYRMRYSRWREIVRGDRDLNIAMMTAIESAHLDLCPHQAVIVLRPFAGEWLRWRLDYQPLPPRTRLPVCGD